MYRLCYISTARRPIDEPGCRAILEVSQRNNRAAGVTGLLIAGSQRFLQALEGEEAVVQRTFGRIKRDPRHFACVILEERQSDRRQFPDWSMGFQRSTGADAGLSDVQHASALIAGIADPNLRAQFEGFLTLQWRGDRAA